MRIRPQTKEKITKDKKFGTKETGKKEDGGKGALKEVHSGERYEAYVASEDDELIMEGLKNFRSLILEKNRLNFGKV